ncbi:MAG: hypothetical protein R2847_07970 [Bacteroidia bacterium]
MPYKERKAIANENIPTAKIARIIFIAICSLKKVTIAVSIASDPLTIFGTVVVTVARRLVPNCSDADVTNTAQYPDAKPISPQTK